jgi:hypothetical protein
LILSRIRSCQSLIQVGSRTVGMSFEVMRKLMAQSRCLRYDGCFLGQDFGGRTAT